MVIFFRLTMVSQTLALVLPSSLIYKHRNIHAPGVHILCTVSQCIVQPVPEKMRLEMVNKMQIEILNVGEIQSTSQNRETQIPRYLAVQIRIETLVGFEFLCISRYKFKSRFWFYLKQQLTKISPPFRISICISLTILCLIFLETGCKRPGVYQFFFAII